MSIRAMKMICPMCRRAYDFNPDVGKYRCPRCAGKSSDMTMGRHGGCVLPGGFLDKRAKFVPDYLEWSEQKPIHS